MNVSVIVPAAGRSSRFPEMRPKWMLTHPYGNMMLVESIRGLDLSNVSVVYITLLREHVEKYDCLDGIHAAIQDSDLSCNYELVILDEPTDSQPETVYRTIILKNITGPVFIKDSDNFFVAEVTSENAVCNIDLNDIGLVNASNKSYVEIDDEGIIKNIVEKQVISSTFCTGGYSFQSANEFCEYYKRLENGNDLYISHVIYSMLLDGHIFHSKKVTDCLDWGTLDDWNRYKGDFATLFVDIDGVIVENSARYFGKLWGETGAIEGNVSVLNKLRSSGKIKIILTTSRCSTYADTTEKQLQKIGLGYDSVIYNLPHAKRIIINDYSSTNPYKSCEAINVSRNSNNLKDMLWELIKNMEE